MQSHLSVHYATTPPQVSPPPRKTAIPLRPHTFRVDNEVVDIHGPELGATAIAIICVLERHADRETGQCYPSIATIARKTRRSCNTVKKELLALNARGIVSWEERWTEAGEPMTHLYTIHRTPRPAPPQQAGGGSTSDLGWVKSGREGGSTSDDN